MAFHSKELNVVLATTHIPYLNVPNTLNEELISNTIDKAITLGHLLGCKKPRVAVAGLNPHAGERGVLGFEEMDIILPAIKKFSSKTATIYGPIPPDTVFWDARKKKYDVIVALYHDQGLIPVKTLAFDSAVNVSLGLPFIRTSPDHGTGFDIAYQDKASPSSMIEALNFCINACKYEKTK